MASISLSQFRQIANGTYNVGDVYINDQNKLDKVNNFVTLKGRNITVLKPDQNVAVRQALFKALSNDQRMTSEMCTKIKGLLLGDNVVRSLARREIKLYLAALDRGDADGLAEKVDYFHNRSQSTALNKSLDKIVYEHTVNERLDMARMGMQRAYQCLARIGMGISPQETRDYSADMKKAWDAFKDSVAEYCAQDKKGLDPETVKAQLSKIGDDAGFAKEQTADEARRMLETMFKDSLNWVPDMFREEASTVAVWGKGGVDIDMADDGLDTVDADGRVATRVPEVRELNDQVDNLEGLAVFDSYSRKDLLAELSKCEKEIQAKSNDLAQKIKDERAKDSSGMEIQEYEEWQQNLESLENDEANCRILLERSRANTKRIQNQVAVNPLSYKSVLLAVKDWTKAADALYCALCKEHNLVERMDIRSAIHLSLPSFDDVKDLDDDCPDPGRYLKDIESKFAKQLSHVFKLLGKKIDAKKVIKPQLKEAFKSVLEHKEWKPIDRDLVFKLGDERVAARSTIAPALQIRGFKANLTVDPLLNPEDDQYVGGGKNGLVSHNTKTGHSNNLACASLSFSDKTDGKDVTVFKGCRHATVCAYGIQDPEQRKVANVNRAKEIIIASALTNDALLEYVENVKDPKSEKNRFPLLITSTSLLTPDWLRHLRLGDFKSSDERKMVEEQVAAWKTVDGETLRIKVPKKDGTEVEVDVTPNVLPFNFGVNALAVLSAMPAITLGGWGLSDEINNESLPKLRNYVMAHLQKLDGMIRYPEEGKETDVEELRYRKSVIDTLMKQIDAIHDAKAEHRDDHDAYKIVSRINVLVYLLGGTPAWNCKSGKDRTGELDVESKFLAALIAKKQEIPQPGAELTPEQRAVFEELIQDGGNFEMQAYNTGVGGFKTDAIRSLDLVSSITERTGDAAQLRKGLSNFVKA